MIFSNLLQKIELNTESYCTTFDKTKVDKQETITRLRSQLVMNMDYVFHILDLYSNSNMAFLHATKKKQK